MFRHMIPVGFIFALFPPSSSKRLKQKIQKSLVCLPGKHICVSYFEAELFPLAVQMVHLLLQEEDVIGEDVLGQVRLHGAELGKTDGPVL